MPTKTYELRHYANKQKEATIVESVKRQQEVLLDTTVRLTEFFFKNGFVPRFAPKGSDWRQINAHNQARGTFNAWLAVLADEGRRLVAYFAPEDEELRHELFTINKAKAWLRTDFKKRDGSEYSAEAWGIIRVVFEIAVEKHPVPTVGFQPTVMLVCPQGISVNEPRKATKFTRWLNFRSDTPYHPIQIPIFDNPYYRNAPGKENATWLFQVKNGNELHIYATKTDDTEPEPPRTSDNPLGLDWGFRNLFATSDGRLLGMQLHSYLVKQDEKITQLAAQLQKLGIPLKQNQRYQQLVAETKATVKNVVGKIFNELSNEDWSELVVENLDFRGRGFSKRMNRLLDNAGRGAVRAKLKQLEAERGFTVTKVNPAYTSQECSRCHFVSRKNRNGDKFLCQNCGFETHADLNAAVNIFERRSFKEIHTWQPKQTVLSLLRDRFLSQNRLNPQDGQDCWLSGSDGVDKTTGGDLSRSFAKHATSETASP